MRLALVAAAGLLAYAAYEWQRQQADGGGWIDDALAEVESATSEVIDMVSGYSPDKVPMQYRDAIAGAEAANGMPAGMLARLLWQECRYRPEIIDGRKRSPAGALGIAQFMPATAADFGIDPLDPFQSIAAAGRYMRQLYARFGDWPRALAAYNWGMGNVARKGLSAAPTETRNYYQQILSDIGLGGLYA